VEGFCEYGIKPSGSIKCWKSLSSCAIGGFSRRAQLHGVSLLSFIESFLLKILLFDNICKRRDRF
jgi:hypothetical protein